MSREQLDLINEVYYKQRMMLGRDKLFDYLKRTHPDAKISRRQIMDWLKNQESHQIHREMRGLLGEMRGLLGEMRGVLGEMRGVSGEMRGVLGEIMGLLGEMMGLLGEMRGVLCDFSTNFH